MTRRGATAHISPNAHKTQPDAIDGETIFDWLHRQKNPRKPATPAVLAIEKTPAGQGEGHASR